jgi:hypothetical protein
MFASDWKALKIGAKIRLGEFKHVIGTQDLADELIYDFGYSQVAVVKSQAATLAQVNTVVRNYKNFRPLHKIGGESKLRLLEMMRLKSWIDARILRHEQPTPVEIRAKV